MMIKKVKCVKETCSGKLSEASWAEEGYEKHRDRQRLLCRLRSEFISSIVHFHGNQMLFHFVRNGEKGGNNTDQMPTVCQAQLQGISYHYFNFN